MGATKLFPELENPSIMTMFEAIFCPALVIDKAANLESMFTTNLSSIHVKRNPECYECRLFCFHSP